MNKQETLEANHAEEIKKLKAIIEAHDTSELVFVPKMGEEYEFVASDGGIFQDKRDSWPFHHEKLKIGNVFRVGEAKNSAKHYIMNSEFDYWHAGFGKPKPTVLPKGLEIYDEAHWSEACAKKVSEMSESFMYRWKRLEQV